MTALSIQGVRNGLVCAATRDGRPLGWIAVDSLVAGRSCGGLRMLPDVTEQELLGLARAMTLKYGLLGFPQGGAKAGVRGDPDAPRDARRARLVEFGAAIAPILRAGIYRPCADMGTRAGDIRHVLDTLGIRVARTDLRRDSSGTYTAASVLASARAALRHMGSDLPGCTAAVEGFGSVGAALSRMLAGAGARVVAVSTSRGALYRPEGLDVERLAARAGELGSLVVEDPGWGDRLDASRLLELPVGLLCPCARHASLHADNASRITARVVCPGANDPVTRAAETLLARQGTLCMPDILANCGGVLGGTMEFAAIPAPGIVSFIDRHMERVAAALLEHADRTGEEPRAIAERTAWTRFRQVMRAAEGPSLSAKLFAAPLALYRRGLLPAAAVRRLAPSYFEQRLSSLAHALRTAAGEDAE